MCCKPVTDVVLNGISNGKWIEMHAFFNNDGGWTWMTIGMNG
jgi:hypothetical protein